MRTAQLVLIIIAAAIAASLAAAKKEVVLVQFLHRHGARTPIVPAALAPSICGPVGCGELTHNGKMQLEALGVYLNDRYVTGAVKPAGADSASAAFATFQDDEYHIKLFQSRSTNVDRTIQSADAVLRGFQKENLTSYFPIVHTVGLEHDTLLLPDTWLSMMIPRTFKATPCINALPTNYDSSSTYTPIATLKTIANELGEQHVLPCDKLTAASDIWEYGACALPMQDTIASFVAMNHTQGIPTALANLKNLTKLIGLVRQCFYVQTSPQQGALAYELVDTMLSNMEAFADKTQTSDNNGDPSTLFFEYSAHDTTVAPTMVALGHPTLVEPEFGQTIVVETINETTTGEMTVRYWYGQPGTMAPPPAAAGRKTNASDYAYKFSEISVTCVDAKTGAIKNATGGVCTVDELRAYANARLKPTDAAGAPCYLSKDFIKNNKDFACDAAGVPGNPSWCANYRKLCPAYACSAHAFTVDQKTLECIPTEFVPPVTLAQAWALASGTTVGGAVLGVALTFIAKALAAPDA